jgi:single-strand DNA-binding protein
MATLRVAVNQFRTDPTSGARVESAEWFRVRALGRLVELAQNLTKGSRVLVIGRLGIGHYQSSEGEARVSYDVWADELVSLTPKGDGGETAGDRHGPEQERSSQPVSPASTGTRARHADRSHSSGTSRPPADHEHEDLPW